MRKGIADFPVPCLRAGIVLFSRSAASSLAFEVNLLGSFRVRFLPEDREIEFDRPISLADAAAVADVLVDHPCGSKACCGKCRVRFHGGAPQPSHADERLLDRSLLADGWRLSCQTVVKSGATVEIPAVSRAASPKGFGPADLLGAGFERALTVHTAALSAPSLADQQSTEDRLELSCGGGIGGGLAPAHLRALQDAAAGGGEVAMLRDHGRLLWLGAPAHLEQPLLGVAIDVGSTSLAAAIIDMRSGQVLASDSTLNAQVQYGADVISRINYAQSHAKGNHHLHRSVIETINRLVGELLAEAGARRENVWCACAAGNSVMLHTLMGVDVRPLGQSPYVGAWTRGRMLDARDIGLDLRAEARLRVFPMVQSNVGGDTVAAIVATGLDRTEKLTLMIDLGTNCEVVLGNRDRILATSTAAGPAFEGANIRHGMRAAPGAIDRVSLQDGGELSVRVFGGGRPRGVCGSALIDAAAILLRARIVDASGRMHGASGVDGALAARITKTDDGQNAIILAHAPQTDNGHDIVLTARDIRQLQLIKGSILAGARTLLSHWGAGVEAIEQVLVAGAFGSFLRKASVQAIGLVPLVDAERIRFVGNAAGVGARMGLVDVASWQRAQAVRQRTEYVELGGTSEYQDLFAESMGFHDVAPPPDRV